MGDLFPSIFACELTLIQSLKQLNLVGDSVLLKGFYKETKLLSFFNLNCVARIALIKVFDGRLRAS